MIRRLADASGWLSRLLVALHFVAATVLVLTTASLPTGLFSGSLTLSGVGVAVWAWLAMGLRHIRVMPAPAPQARLVTAGPYRSIRHPMYSGLLLFCAGLVVQDPRFWRCVVWFALLVVLLLKTVIEERLLRAHLTGYEQYMATTKRFLPGIF